MMTPSKRKQPDGCSHDDITSFESYTNDLGYFKSAYLEKAPYWPNQCHECATMFVDKPESQIAENEYKVCMKNPAFLCKNAAKSTHPCTFGLCKTCRKSVLGASPTRKRNRKRHLDDEY
jgi:hypothetical protein